MWTWQCRWCRKRRHCIRSCGRAVSTGAFTAATIGSASMRCSTSMRCRGEGIFQEPTGNGKRRSRLLPRGVAHPAIESAINGLEHRGLDRVRSHGADGFARTVALSVLAANLHRIGLILQKRERKRQRLVA